MRVGRTRRRLHYHRPGDPLVKVLWRALLALSMAGIAAAAIRLRGRGGIPPQTGGWQELPLHDRG